MDPDRPRRRVRISTLMLLVIIAGLMSYIVVLWQRERQARLEAELMRAMAEAEQARARAVLLQLQGTLGRGGQAPAGAESKAEWLKPSGGDRRWARPRQMMRRGIEVAPRSPACQTGGSPTKRPDGGVRPGGANGRT